MRNVAVLTGKRGGYGAMKPMLHAIEDDPELSLSLIVTDQHVNPRFGATIAEIEKEFNVAAAVDIGQKDGSAVARNQALGVCLSRMSVVLDELKPDILVLYGDRGEVLVTAIAAVNLGIPIAHIQGGDVSGNVDEMVRHAITKIAHLHFPSNEESGDRIAAMGEEKERIFVVGDNHIDQIVAGNYTPEVTLREKFSIPDGERPIIVLQHPETTRQRDGYRDMCDTLDAVLEVGRRTIMVYPCSDHGYEGVVRAIEERSDRSMVSVHKNIDAPDFWGLLSIAQVLVGNSSAGLIETPYFPIAAINVGERQKGRKAAENVIHVDLGRDSVAAALEHALNDERFERQVLECSKPFGDGNAWKRIISVIKSVELGVGLIDKRITC